VAFDLEAMLEVKNDSVGSERDKVAKEGNGIGWAPLGITIGCWRFEDVLGIISILSIGTGSGREAVDLTAAKADTGFGFSFVLAVTAVALVMRAGSGRPLVMFESFFPFGWLRLRCESKPIRMLELKK
jgi:hypothetical protein